MRNLKRIFIIIIGIFFLALSLFIVSISLNLLSPQDIANVIDLVSTNDELRLLLGTVGTLLTIFSLLGIQITLGKLQKEKTIAFTNPNGQVTVSLRAIEDFLHKIMRSVEEVKELKANVFASKKGIQIDTRAVLWSNTDIPATTEKIQQLIKMRLQEMLSIEEPINIHVHVVKIEERKSDVDKETPETPFRSYKFLRG